MKKGQKAVYASLFCIIAAFILGFYIDKKTAIMLALSFILVYSYLIYREKIGQELVVAGLFGLIITSYYTYEYTTLNLALGKINLFPFMSWTFGLIVLREIYERSRVRNKFLIISMLYILVLFIVEYIGYYLLGIRLNSNYPSLLNIGVIHAPIEMKIFYVLAGPVYLLATDYLKVR